MLHFHELVFSPSKAAFAPSCPAKRLPLALKHKSQLMALNPRRCVHGQGGIGMLYKGGLARTARLCGAFFIINTVREFAMSMKAKWASESESGTVEA